MLAQEIEKQVQEQMKKRADCAAHDLACVLWI